MVPDRFNKIYNILDIDNIILKTLSKLKYCDASAHKSYRKEYIKKPFITDSRYISDEEKNKFIQEDLNNIKEIKEYYKNLEMSIIFYQLEDDNNESEYKDDYVSDNEKYYSSDSEDEFYSTVNEEYLYKF